MGEFLDKLTPSDRKRVVDFTNASDAKNDDKSFLYAGGNGLTEQMNASGLTSRMEQNAQLFVEDRTTFDKRYTALAEEGFIKAGGHAK